MLAVVIIIGGLSWTLFNSNQTAAPPSSTENSQTTQNPSNSTEPQNTEVPSETSDSSTNSPDSTVTNTSETSPQTSSVLPEEVRDAAMTYVKTKHSRTAQFMTDLSWTGSRLDTEELGNETYVYYASSWTVTVRWPLVSNPTYSISASYNSEETFIIWQGTYQNGSIKETSYTQNP